MLTFLVKFLIGILLSISGFFYIKNILNSDIKLFNIKNIFLLLILSFLTSISFKTNYKFINPIISFSSSLFVYKLIFKYPLINAIIITAFLMVSLCVGELISILFLSPFYQIDYIRSNSYILLLSNCFICLNLISLSFFKFFKSFTQKFFVRKYESKIYDMILYVFFTVISVSFLLLIISWNFYLDIKLIVFSITFVFIVLLFYFYFKEKSDYKLLYSKYDSIMEIMSNFEECIEKDKLIIHEYKNDLAVILSMVSDKKSRDYIIKKLDNYSVSNDFDYKDLNYIPNTGLRSLILYKNIKAKNENINFNLSISKKLKEYNIVFTDKNFQDLCYLVGIFLDNAIEASSCSSKKTILFEMYITNSNILKIVISNTYFGDISLNKIFNKGYSTKGKLRGNGLFFASKICKSNSNLDFSSKIVNKFFVQEIYYFIT